MPVKLEKRRVALIHVRPDDGAKGGVLGRGGQANQARDKDRSGKAEQLHAAHLG